MSAQHTPGPWWPTDYGVRDSGGYIAHMKSVQRYEGQDERYAREVAQRAADKLLIAAAPDLPQELTYLVEIAESAMRAANRDGGEYEIKEMLAGPLSAIAKTTGSAA